MSSYRVIYVDYNFTANNYPNRPEDGESFYTHGFGGLYAREFKKFNPDLQVECWKTDSRIKKVYTKEISGVKFIVFPSLYILKLGDFSITLIRHLRKTLRSSGFRLVINISSCDHLLFYSIAPYLKKVPLVVQSHGESPARYSFFHKKGIRKLKAAIRYLLEKRAFKEVDWFYGLDEDITDWLPHRYKMTNFSVQTTGVNPELFPQTDKLKARKQLGLDECKKYILSIGKLDMTKRPDILLAAFKIVKNDLPDVELLICGAKETDLYYQEAIDAGATVKGLILQMDIFIYLSASDVYILPDLSHEHKYGGIGMLPVQSMMCNTPVVGNSIKNLPISIRDKMGIIASDAGTISQGVRKILSKQYEASDLRQNAIHYYSWERIAQQTRKNYDKIFLKYFYGKN